MGKQNDPLGIIRFRQRRSGHTYAQVLRIAQDIQKRPVGLLMPYPDEDVAERYKTMLEKEGIKCKYKPMNDPETPIIGLEYPEKKFTGYLFTKI